MKLLKLGVVLVFIIVAAIASFASINKEISYEVMSIDSLNTFKEEVCVDNLGNITCTENTYLQHNGQKLNVPIMTSYTIYEKIFVPKYIETEKIVIKEKKLTGEEMPSPVDRIKDSDVRVYSNRVTINIKNPSWRTYIDSNSMDPLIDEGTTTIEIKPKNADEIKIGDIIAYDVEGYDYAFVHRVIKTGSDQEGSYFITKGDNYYKEDPKKIRFSDVEGIVVGILY